VGRPDFKSGWDCLTVSGGFDSHPPPPPNKTKRLDKIGKKNQWIRSKSAGKKCCKLLQGNTV
jgi:hypothetical protein